MKGTEKNLAGPAIVIGILLLATLGAGMTWRNYAAERPNAVRAELQDRQTVLAEFRPEQASLIRVGNRAIISWEGVRSTGVLREQAGPRSFRIVLFQPFDAAPAGAACQVTVDLSLPPEP